MMKNTMQMNIHASLHSIALMLLLVNINPVLAAAGNKTDQTLTPATLSKVKATLSRIIPDKEPDNIEAAVISGMYEISYGTDIFYLTEDGKHLIQGDIYDLESQSNLTESKRSSGRNAIINAIDPATMIIFKPAKTDHIVTVFTDIDCGYCRKLHSEMDSYLGKNIEIRYMAYPRSGTNTRSYFKAIHAWCADDRKQALTQSKAGTTIEEKTCAHPIDQHMAAAKQLGITGTPALVFSDGTLLPGYLPAARLEQYLKNL